MKKKKSKSENKHEPLTRQDFTSQEAYLKYVITRTNQNIAESNKRIQETNNILRRMNFQIEFREMDSTKIATDVILLRLQKETIPVKDIFFSLMTCRNHISFLKRRKRTYLKLYPEFQQLNHN